MSQRILFICQLNMVRSPIAEGLAKAKGLDAESCGLDPGEADELVTAVMKEIGIDLSQHEPTALTDYQDQRFDRIVCFSEDSRAAAEAVFGDDLPTELWSVPNPASGNFDVRAIMDTYRSIRTVIANRIDRLA
ncbi:MAG: hypothetical protein WBF53_12130 [Litorimonas sp.]